MRIIAACCLCMVLALLAVFCLLIGWGKACTACLLAMALLGACTLGYSLCCMLSFTWRYLVAPPTREDIVKEWHQSRRL